MHFLTDDIELPPGPARRRPGLRVRDAIAGDAAELAQMWNDGLPSRMPEAGGNGVHAWPATVQSAEELVVTHERARRPLWLAMQDGITVAMLSFYGMSDHPGSEQVAELAIHVRHGRRGQGIGREMLAQAIGFGPGAGFGRYIAWIRADNVASLGLFRNAGFNCWGRIPGGSRHGTKMLDLVLFGLELDKV